MSNWSERMIKGSGRVVFQTKNLNFFKNRTTELFHSPLKFGISRAYCQGILEIKGVFHKFNKNLVLFLN